MAAPINPLKAIRIQGQAYDLATQAEIHSDTEGINQGLRENPSLFAWWAIMEADAMRRMMMYKDQLEALDATLYGKFQTEGSFEQNGKQVRPTVESIKARVILHKERQALAEKLRQAEHEHELCIVGRRTMDQRRESLLAVASNMRAEMDGRLAVRRREVQDAYASGRLSKPNPPPPGTRTSAWPPA